MITPADIAKNLADELMQVVAKYDDAILLSTAIGVIEIVKQKLIEEAV